jgi:Protein of unknown function (DUF4240)
MKVRTGPNWASIGLGTFNQWGNVLFQGHTLRMDGEAFWELIEQARSTTHDDEHLVERVATALLALPTEEILDFEEHLSEAEHRAYRWEVGGAAYLINGGCSDDGFQDFRAWLVAQGRDTFTRGVADPDSLTEHPAVRRMADARRDGWLGLESLRYVAEDLRTPGFRQVAWPHVVADRWPCASCGASAQSRWSRMLMTLPSGARTKKRRTPHGSVVIGWTIS